jgi:Uma2 family endonuclease
MSSTTVWPPGEGGYTRKKWTVKECRFLADSGILAPGNYELIDGEIISKLGQGRMHIAVVTHIIAALAAIFGIESVQSQAQIGIGERDPLSDPEPDVAVLAEPVASFINREPDPEQDVLLVVEASDKTLQGDTTTKARLYSRNGVREHWVVSIAARELIVHRSPSADGYRDVCSLSAGESVSPLSRPDVSVAVADLFV